MSQWWRGRSIVDNQDHPSHNTLDHYIVYFLFCNEFFECSKLFKLGSIKFNLPNVILKKTLQTKHI